MDAQSNNVFQTPTERIDLPSKGWLYPSENPLSKGYIEITYPTAKHEDILTNPNYIQQGIVEEKFLEALIVTPIDYKSLLQGDKDAIMVAARILGFGKDYTFTRLGQRYTVDLTTLKERELDGSIIKQGVTEYDFTMPVGKAVITYKYLTLADEAFIDKEEEALKKVFPNYSGQSTLFLRQSIVAVNGNRTKGEINAFVERMLIPDSKAFKKHYLDTRPGLEFTADAKNAKGEVLEGFRVPITLDFFWPES